MSKALTRGGGFMPNSALDTNLRYHPGFHGDSFFSIVMTTSKAILKCTQLDEELHAVVNGLPFFNFQMENVAFKSLTVFALTIHFKF